MSSQFFYVYEYEIEFPESEVSFLFDAINFSTKTHQPTQATQEAK